ncbi:hypothetical protein PYJP_12990 [Pyrofollis japonicus]|uniref:DUF4212 domain-containing protein n=1 Tax=Pyrofollis japonicus TaxID=3060460 RepID=UPI00295C2974|nr:sodium/substrate symporter small subunit [Pyrofollis japonicus]BEP17947.1 hypothetical protein PYJP_12990 [Pyrofollis japonicus]
MVATSKVLAYKKAFATWTTIYFIVWLVIALGLHLPAKQFYAPPGSEARIGGAPLNWWMIQISIALGIVLAFLYAYTINKLDEKFEKNV